MENSNRPVQRVIPIRSELQSRTDSNFSCQSSSSFSDTTCSGTNQQYKLIGSGNDQNSNHSGNIIDSVPFVQQNVNIMNINLSNNALIQGVTKDPGNSFSGTPKTYLQLSDGRYVQIAQNIQQAQQHQIPTTILLQMPYKLIDQAVPTLNQPLINKRLLLPSKTNDKSPQNSRFVTAVGNTAVNSNSLLMGSVNQQTELYSKVDAQIRQMELQSQPLNDYQRNMMSQLKEVKDQMSGGVTMSSNGNILPLDKYQEICDMLHEKRLLTKAMVMGGHEETVLVEFRLNQQKYQLRMTRGQKVDMEKLLISAGNQQRQMEILQVYQSEQRKNMQPRTSVVLNQIINKNTPNIICNGPQIQTLNIAKPMYHPLNPVLMAVPQTQYNDVGLLQSKSISNQSTASANNPNGVILTTRMPLAQSSIMSVPSIPRDIVKDSMKQKRIVKTPVINLQQNVNSNQDMKPARSRRYNNMRKLLLDDQTSVLTPVYKNPFEDLDDVARRLLPYHILEESKDLNLDQVDNILNGTFIELTKKCTNLKRIASSITMNDLIADKREEEQLLIKRMQLDLERDLFEREKSAAIENMTPLQFDDLDNSVIIIEDSPPPPLVTHHNTEQTHLQELQDEEEKLEQQQRKLDEIVTATSAVETAAAMSSSSFIESILQPIVEVQDNEENMSSSDTLLDSLYNYDIQDISNDDSLDSIVTNDNSDMIMTVTDNGGVEEEHVEEAESCQQSEDPDLDAAIKSILF